MMSIAIAAAFAFAIAVGVAVGLCMRNNGWAEALFGCAVIAVIFAAMCGVLYLAGVGNSASTATNMETAQHWSSSAGVYMIALTATVAMIVSLVASRVANR
jgi:hypothetical protein